MIILTEQEAFIEARKFLTKRGIDTFEMTDEQIKEKFVAIVIPAMDAFVNVLFVASIKSAKYLSKIKRKRLQTRRNFGPHTNNWRKMHGLKMRRR